MFQWNIRIAALFIASAALATTAAAQPGKQGGKPGGAPAARAAPAPHPAPAPHVAAAPRAAPAPHASAPRVAGPRAVSHIAAPHVSAQRAARQQLARPSGGPPASALARHAKAPRTVAPAQQPQTTGRNVGSRGGAKLAQPSQPSPRNNQARQHGPGSAATVGAAAAGAAAAAQSAHVGRNAAQQQNATEPNQLSRTAPSAARAASNARAFSGGVLRNQAFANLSAARDPSARALAGSTFQGRFFDPQWRRHRPFPAVIGWVGPLFWPYAYDDFVDYTFYPYAYDTFWPYAYDDFYDGMFGAYAEGYGGTYAAVGPPESYRGRRSASAHGGRGSAAGRSVGADLCSGQTAGLTDWPIERIAQTVEPNDAQRAALDELKDATAQALDILKAACPTALPSTPTGRIEAMRQRLEAMAQAVRTVRPALDKFYQSLNDEQKARFSALGSDDNQQQAKRDLTQACGERASGIASLPLQQIERAVQLDEAQRAGLKELQDATSEAANLLRSDCPTDRALTPVGRLQAMEQRLDAMLRAVQAVEPALQKFYASLGDEQKERFNRLSPTQG
jgi:hypothetical protein